MVDLTMATDLHGFANSDPGPEQPRAFYMERLEEGLVHADYGDLDHVFLIRVQQVPRRRLAAPVEPIAVVEEGDVYLREVTIANHVEVLLQLRGPRADDEVEQHSSVVAGWLAAGGADSGDMPPAGWAGELVQSLQVRVSDDVGTPYRRASGQWDSGEPASARVRFLPAPGVGAVALRVQLWLRGSLVGEATLPLGD